LACTDPGLIDFSFVWFEQPQAYQDSCERTSLQALSGDASIHEILEKNIVLVRCTGTQPEIG